MTFPNWKRKDERIVEINNNYSGDDFWRICNQVEISVYMQ